MWAVAIGRLVARAGRVALGHIVDRSLALVEYLRESGPSQVHNMDALLLRESMDVIGVHLCSNAPCHTSPSPPQHACGVACRPRALPCAACLHATSSRWCVQAASGFSAR